MNEDDTGDERDPRCHSEREGEDGPVRSVAEPQPPGRCEDGCDHQWPQDRVLPNKSKTDRRYGRNKPGHTEAAERRED